MPDTYKLCYKGNAIIVDRLPLSNWTIVDTGQLSINGNTITQNGVGGWCESMYISFTVPETGSYEISYDYDIANAVVGGHGTYGFGLWLTTNNPHVTGDAQYNFYANSNNRNGPIIGNTNQNISGMKGHKSYKTTLNAGTTYYLWYPGAALNDGTTFTLSFSNINVFNDPVQYDYVVPNILTYPSWNGNIDYEKSNYYLDLFQTVGGTIGSNALEGNKGDIITLSNTANNGYAFTNYTLTGANLTGNQFTFTGTDVSAQANFSVKPNTIILYNDSSEKSSNKTLTVNTNATNNDSYYRYWKVQFDRMATTASIFACWAHINFNGQTYSMRSHYKNSTSKRHCYMGWAGGPNYNTTFTTNSTTTTTVDNVTLYMTTASTPISTYQTYKYIFDSTNGWCSAYINGVFGGTIKPTSTKTLTACNSLEAAQEVTASNRYSKFKNIKIGVADTWANANNL